MSRLSKMLALPFAALLVIAGIAPAATAAPAAAATSTVSATTTSAQRLLVTGWRMYDNSFYSSNTCESRRAIWHSQYAGYWIGGWHSSRCVRYAIPSCGATTYKWRVDIRTYYSENGPFRVEPLASASAGAVIAAC